MPLPDPTIYVTDARGYSYDETSDDWKQRCAALPCFAAMHWPGYDTRVVEDVIDGQAVVIQLWKGLCSQFLGLSNFPGGYGAKSASTGACRAGMSLRTSLGSRTDSRPYAARRHHRPGRALVAMARARHNYLLRDDKSRHGAALSLCTAGDHVLAEPVDAAILVQRLPTRPSAATAKLADRLPPRLHHQRQIVQLVGGSMRRVRENRVEVNPRTRCGRSALWPHGSCSATL